MTSFAKLSLMYTTIMVLMQGYALALSHLGAPARRDTDNRTYVMCTFDFDHSSTAHTGGEGYFAFAGTSILHFRKLLNLKQRYRPFITTGSLSAEVETNLIAVPQGIVMSTLLSLLDSAGKYFDDQSLEWYIVQGSLIGWLRFQSFIPWDEDIDFMMPTFDRLKLREWFLSNGTDSLFVDGDTVAIQDPNNPKFIGVLRGREAVDKILWVDLETEIALDGCFNVGNGCSNVNVDFSVPTSNVEFGGVKARIPMDMWGGHGLDQKPGVEVGQKACIENYTKCTISMSIEKYTKCTFYTCDQEAPRKSTAGSLSDLYKQDASAKLGPYHFQSTGDDGHYVCSVPRNYQACREDETLESIMVEQCGQ